MVASSGILSKLTSLVSGKPKWVYITGIGLLMLAGYWFFVRPKKSNPSRARRFRARSKVRRLARGARRRSA
jgi:hypothetical protein